MMIGIQLALAAALTCWCPWVQFLKTRNRSWLVTLIAGGCGSLSLLLASGKSLGMLLALPWGAWCVYDAFRSFKQTLIWGPDHFGHLANGLAAIFLLGALMWFASARLASPFLDFSEPWKTLTAIHFHYSGFLMLSILALHWEPIRKNLSPRLALVFSIATLLYVLSFALVAAGINGRRETELAGVSLLVASLLVLGSLIYRAHRPLKTGLKRMTGFSSALVTIVSFSLAFIYAWRLIPGVGFEFMIPAHGLLNAFVFLPLLMGFTALVTEPLPFRKIPFSRLRSVWKVGPAIFDKLGLRNETKNGLVDQMREFDRDDFDSSRMRREVRDFYEQTADFEMHVASTPGFVFKPLWRYFVKPFFATIQQLNLPDRDKEISGKIIALDPALDGRKSPRGWMRTDKRSGRAVYAAAYAVHERGSVTYMNIAFPLPLSNMTSVLHIDHLNEYEGAIRLSTLQCKNRWGDQGVYLVFKHWTLRLPIDEIIDVWFSEVLRARHTMWFCGWNYLTLEYSLSRKP